MSGELETRTIPSFIIREFTRPPEEVARKDAQAAGETPALAAVAAASDFPQAEPETLTPRLDRPNSVDPKVWEDPVWSMDGLERNAAADIYAFMGLFHELGVQMRRSAIEEREAAATNQMAALGDGAQKAREAANWRLAGGIASGAMSVAGGVAGIGIGVYSGVQAGKAAAPLPPNATAQQVQAKAAAAGRAQMSTALVQPTAMLFQGLGQFASAPLEYQAGMADAGKLLEDREATLADQRRQQAAERKASLEELLRDIRQKLTDVQQSNNQTLSQIWKA